MKAKANDPVTQISDLRQLGDTAEEIHAALQDPAIFEAIFGEPSDEEIAEALRQAEAEFEAGLYKPPKNDPDAAEDDDEPYRTPTRQEILQGIKRGYIQALAGDVLTLEEFREQLKE